MGDLLEMINLRTLAIVLLSASIALILFRVLAVPLLRQRNVLRYGARCPSLQLAALPSEFNRQILHVALSNRRSYHVNLYHLTCSCRRFRSFRGFFPAHDIRRLCRHLRRELEINGQLPRFDEVAQRIITDKVQDRCYQRMTVLGTQLVIGFHPKSDFVRVFTRRKNVSDPPEGPYTGVYDKFVLHLSQEHWIYGEAPPGSQEIIRAISAALGGFKAPAAASPLLGTSDPPLD